MAQQRLASLRGSSHKDAGGLVVAADSEHARRIAKILRDHGEDPITVLHTDPGAHKKLAAFRESDRAWIVAVNMVSEGVDIPRLRVGVYAAAAKTPLIFRQVVGRFVRVIPGRPPTDRSWLYIPADPRLRQHATDVEGDLRHILIPQEPGDGSELDEPEERRRGELTEKRDFRPVLADVQAQMDLFAGVDGGGGGLSAEATDAHAGFMGAASAAAERAGEAAEEAAAVEETQAPDPLDPWALDDGEDEDDDTTRRVPGSAPSPAARSQHPLPPPIDQPGSTRSSCVAVATPSSLSWPA